MSERRIERLEPGTETISSGSGASAPSGGGSFRTKAHGSIEFADSVSGGRLVDSMETLDAQAVTRIPSPKLTKPSAFPTSQAENFNN